MQQASNSTASLSSASSKISDGPVIIPTKLFSRNVDVDGYNSEQLKKLALAQGEVIADRQIDRLCCDVR